MVDRSDSRWLSTGEAAALIGLTPRTLYRLIDSGQVPAYRFGRVIRLRSHEVEAATEAARVEPGTLTHLWRLPAGEELPVEDGDGTDSTEVERLDIGEDDIDE